MTKAFYLSDDEKTIRLVFDKDELDAGHIDLKFLDLCIMVKALMHPSDDYKRKEVTT